MNEEQLEEYLNNRANVLRENVRYYEERLRNIDKRSFYYDSYVKAIQKLNAKREMIREILDYINSGKEVEK